MNTLIIQPDTSLIDEIRSHLKNKGKDYSSNLVIFPGKRPSHFLRKAIARGIKQSFIPPVILSMDEFIDYAYENMCTERKLETIDAVAILYDIQRKSLQPIRPPKRSAPILRRSAIKTCSIFPASLP